MDERGEREGGCRLGGSSSGGWWWCGWWELRCCWWEEEGRDMAQGSEHCEERRPSRRGGGVGDCSRKRRRGSGAWDGDGWGMSRASHEGGGKGWRG